MADDFGFDKFPISSIGKNVKGNKANQYSDWEDSSLVLNDKELFIVVKGGGTPDTADKYSEWASWFCSKHEVGVCHFVRNFVYDTCKSPNWCPNPKYPAKFINVTNAPCVFRQGKGLYGLAIKPGAKISDPNSTKLSNMLPDTINAETFHLGDKNNLRNGRYKDRGGYKGRVPNSPAGSRLYFKILDNYYEDNSGSYSLIVKSGAVNPNPGPIETIINHTQNTLKKAAERFYKQIVSSQDYRNSLRATTILFVIITAICFNMGLIEMSQKELILIIFKIALMSELLANTASWNFFNNYFFKIFTDGANEIIAIVISSTTNGSPSGLSFFDKFIGLFLSEEVSAKIWSLLTADFGLALFTIPIMYVAVLLFIIALATGVVFFLTGYIAISLIIILAPIFFIFLLFQITRSLFESWLRQLVSYFLQPILIMAALGFIAQMIIDQLYRIFGFTVCWQPWLKILNLTIAHMWKAVPFSREKDIIHVPGYITKPNNPNHICDPYECTAERYVDLPFLDLVKDKYLIDAFFAGNWSIIFFETFILLLLTYLMLRFNDIVPSIAKGIADTPANQASFKQATKSVVSSLKSLVKSPFKAAYFAANTYSGGKLDESYNKLTALRNKIVQPFVGIKEYVQDKIGGTIDRGVTSVKNRMLSLITPEHLHSNDKKVKRFDTWYNENVANPLGSAYDYWQEWQEQTKADIFTSNFAGTDHRMRQAKQNEQFINKIVEQEIVHESNQRRLRNQNTLTANEKLVIARARKQEIKQSMNHIIDKIVKGRAERHLKKIMGNRTISAAKLQVTINTLRRTNHNFRKFETPDDIMRDKKR